MAEESPEPDSQTESPAEGAEEVGLAHGAGLSAQSGVGPLLGDR